MKKNLASITTWVSAFILMLLLIIPIAFLPAQKEDVYIPGSPRGSKPVIMQLPDGTNLVSWTTETGNQFRVRFNEFEAIAIVKGNVQLMMKSGRTIQTGIDHADWEALQEKVPEILPRTIATLEEQDNDTD